MIDFELLQWLSIFGITIRINFCNGKYFVMVFFSLQNIEGAHLRNSFWAPEIFRAGTKSKSLADDFAAMEEGSGDCFPWILKSLLRRNYNFLYAKILGSHRPRMRLNRQYTSQMYVGPWLPSDCLLVVLSVIHPTKTPAIKGPKTG